MGGHCIKTWSSTQGAVALSSAEAEFYAMVDGVQRAKWMVTVAKEVGFKHVEGDIVLGTDSSAAKSFVARRGLGRMRHIEVRDLWLQQEVLEGSELHESWYGLSSTPGALDKGTDQGNACLL